MALTRKFLASKGIDAAVIDEIITAHTETVSGLKDDLDKANSYKEKAEKLDAVQKELNDLKAEVAKNGGKSYEALKKEFDDFKADVAKKEARTAKETAYKEILKDAGIPEKHFAKILKYSDVDGVELDEKGQIKTKADILKAIKEEWADHIEKKEQKGADVKNPPANNGDKGFTKLSLADKMSYANAHPDDPDVKAWLESDLTAAPPANNDNQKK